MEISSLFSLKDHVAIVTGGLGLLGQEHTKILASAQAKIVILDLDSAKCKDMATQLQQKYQIEALGIGLDITQKPQVEEMVATVVSHFGQIDILINNAAINDTFDPDKPAAKFSQFEHFPLELWQNSINANLTGTFLCCQAVGKEMVERSKGVVINIASTYAIAAPDQRIYQKKDGTQKFFKSVSYGVTKAALINLTKYLATYWADKNIRVNALVPGGVFDNQEPEFVENYSKRTPLGRMANKEEYQGAILFLASQASSYMTGASLVVDGGWTTW